MTYCDCVILINLVLVHSKWRKHLELKNMYLLFHALPLYLIN